MKILKSIIKKMPIISRFVKQRDILIKERDVLLKERDGLIKERDVLINERDVLIKERDGLIKERDVLINEQRLLLDRNKALSLRTEKDIPDINIFDNILNKDKFNSLINVASLDRESLVNFIKSHISLTQEKINSFEERYETELDFNEIVERRLTTAFGYYIGKINHIFKWLIDSNEVANFTYELQERNFLYMAFFISGVTQKSVKEITGYIEEIRNDNILKEHIIKWTAQSSHRFYSDMTVFLGRRIGWYAFIRALKPKYIIETGVDKGLGTCVIASAVKKNKEEGYEGRFNSTDLNPNAGDLLQEEYRNYGEIIYGDSIETLKNVKDKIDIFINDSDHSSGYEAAEYEIIKDKLAEKAILIGDNSHVTESLCNFSEKYNRKFLFFREEPYEHWYPGAGFGVSFI